MRQRRKTAAQTPAAAEFGTGFLLFFTLAASAGIALFLTMASPAPAAGIIVRPSPGALDSAVAGPGRLTSGNIYLQRAGSVARRHAERVAAEIDVTVTGMTAEVAVTQRFRNPHAQDAEGLYVFPLPDGAAVDTVRIEIGDRIIESRVADLALAREIYDRARQGGPLAHLIAEATPNTFTQALSRIPPGAEVRVKIQYQQFVRPRDGIFRLRVPLRSGTRKRQEGLIRMIGYRAGTSALPWQPAPSRTKTASLFVQARIAAGAPIGSVWSLNHPVALKRSGEDVALLVSTDEAAAVDEDFELSWSLDPGALPRTRIFTEALGDARYVMAMTTPPDIASGGSATQREIIFVIDGSGSMGGAALAQTKTALTRAISDLGPDDRFNIIRFDQGVETLFGEARAASPGARAEGRSFVARIVARGGTNLLPALKTALSDSTPESRSHIRQVVFITDGAIAAEGKILNELARSRGRSRLFLVGIGSAPDPAFMHRAAEIGRGRYLGIESGDRVLQPLTALLTRLQRPVITNLKARWTSGLVTEVWPDPLPDLYADEPLVLSARLPALTGMLTLSGDYAGGAWKQDIRLEQGTPGVGVARLWAARKIASLEARRHAGQSAESVDAAVRDISLMHRLAGRTTGLIAVEYARPGPDEQTAAVKTEYPMNPPAEWANDAQYGEANRPAFPTLGAARTTTGSILKLKGPAAEAAPGGAPARTAFLGQDAAGAAPPAKAGGKVENGAIFALLALFFGAMSVMTLGFWRHLRREYASSWWTGRRI